MSVNTSKLQTILLKLLLERKDNRLGKGEHYLAERFRAQFPKDEKIFPQHFMMAAWSLVAQGLAYIDFNQPAPENWEIRLTESGEAAAKDQEINPDDPSGYMQRLSDIVPDASEIVLRYARETLTSYNARCYLASAVMLGVASEAAFLETAISFGNWLPSSQAEKLLEIIRDPRTAYIRKFSEFRKRMETFKPKMPDELTDGMLLTLDSVLDLLRIYRNDAGHPTGRLVKREDAFINLQMFARYLQKLYALKKYFDGNLITS